ncbi:MAG: FecR domain-containing protein [Odoribacteraceae bacterium]|jgi:ferric-dicitrate binding protein FerR (iron transport regulator)|nr:FecR domain-containing protein [Odoribacteraceae bacterium]
MEAKNDHIARLISLSLSGALNEEGEKELQRWMAESPGNGPFARRLLAGEGLEEKYRLYQRVDSGKALARFERARGGRRRVIARVARYAALLLLPLAGLYIATRTGNDARRDVALPAAGIHPGYPRATLSRSTGEEFVLDGAVEKEARLPGHIRVTPLEGSIAYVDVPAGNGVENRLETPRGGEYRLTLADGTRVHLNARTVLRYPEAFRGDAREVFLEGEAWFEVDGGDGRPFHVVTGAARVVVHGTRFNVNASRAGIVETALVEGSVGLRIAGREEEVRLRAGEVAEYRVEGDRLTLKETDLLPHVAWKDNLFVFSGEPLGSILEKLSCWYDFSVEYADESAAATRFSGYMKRYDDISVILEAIEKTAGVVFRIDGRRVVVDRARGE